MIFGGVLLLTRVRKPKKKAMFEMEAQLAEESASLLVGEPSDAAKAQQRVRCPSGLRFCCFLTSHMHQGAARVARGSMLTKLRTMLASATVSCGKHATLTPLAAYRSETEKGEEDAGDGA